MVAVSLKKKIPGARVAVGHGQMKGDDLEQVMVQFIEGEFDVLIATTIIESGLDIPNANTIIINNAHMFGLSDLHQMRGRVGRSNIKAYCYLLAPPMYTLPEDGRRRLQAIEEYSDLGSGFNVAMRDMDIRGAGNLLGAEQSGFISEIGFHMYHKILDEAMQELRDGEFGDLLDNENNTHSTKKLSVQATVEPDFEARIPETYISNVAERLNMYSALSAINEEETLESFTLELVDRFGDMPKALRNLVWSIKLKIAAQNLYAEKVKTRGKEVLLYFHNELGEEFYQAPTFGTIMNSVNQEPEHFSFKQGKNHLILTVKGNNDFRSALERIKALDSSKAFIPTK